MKGIFLLGFLGPEKLNYYGLAGRLMSCPCCYPPRCWPPITSGHVQHGILDTISPSMNIWYGRSHDAGTTLRRRLWVSADLLGFRALDSEQINPIVCYQVISKMRFDYRRFVRTFHSCICHDTCNHKAIAISVSIFKHMRWENIALRRSLHHHGNIASERSPKSGLRPTLIEWLQWFFLVHSTIDSTAHSFPLHSLEQCISTTPMTNIPPGRDTNPVPLSFFKHVWRCNPDNTRCWTDASVMLVRRRKRWINM